MNENTHIDNELAAKILSGEGGIEEEKQLQEWLADHEDARKEWDKLRSSWDMPADLLEMQSIDVDRAWGRFNNRVRKDSVPQQPHETRVLWFSSRQLLRVAAMLLFILATAAASYWLINKNSGKPEMMVASNSNASPYTVHLPDGSQVTLNHGTTLEYPAIFKGGLREVKLSGEAFFEVMPDKSKPFIVQASDATIRVVGTSFNVSAYKNKPEVNVVVETGKVEFFAKNKPSEKILIVPGRRGTLSSKTNMIVSGINKDVNFLAWKTRYIHFKNTPLPEVSEVLHDVYNIEIKLDIDKFVNTKINVDFRDDSIETIIRVLKSSSLANGYQVIQNGNTIEIR